MTWRIYHLLLCRTNLDEDNQVYLDSEEATVFLQSLLLSEDEDYLPKTTLEVLEKITQLEKHQDALFTPLEMFQLNQMEKEVLILALAPDLDYRFGKLFSYVQEDSNQTQSSIGLAIKLLANNSLEKISTLWKIFSPNSTLSYFNLIHFFTPSKNAVTAETNFVLDQTTRCLLLGENILPASLESFIQIDAYNSQQNNIALYPSIREIFDSIQPYLNHPTKYHIVYLYGKALADQQTFVKYVAGYLQKPVIKVNFSEIFKNSQPIDILKNILREVYIRSGLLSITSQDVVATQYKDFLNFLENLPSFLPRLVIFISSQQLWCPESSLNYFWQTYEFKMPDPIVQCQIWKKMLVQKATEQEIISDEEIVRLVSKFSLCSSDIERITSQLSPIKVNQPNQYFAALERSLSEQFQPEISQGVSRVVSTYLWKDLVLPTPQFSQLQSIFDHLKYRHHVYYQWGFSKKSPLNRGVNILFSGSSGTGKTMAAMVLASELNLPLYKVNISTLISKWIGETEKNLEKAFALTSYRNILLFDEADSLFSKRTDVQDSNDRYANIETNFLLQKLEEHEGIIILATNLNSNLDKAFLRRFHFTISFLLPDISEREKIWRKVFPQEAPLGQIDYTFLAKKIDVSGGNIKNIALHAAFLACKEMASHIEMSHICCATKREFEKHGKIFDQTDFRDFV